MIRYRNLFLQNIGLNFLHDKLIKFNKILDSKDDLDFYKKTLFAWGDESEAIFNNKIISDNDDLILNKDQINDGSLKNLQLLDFNNYLINDILVKLIGLQWHMV